MEEQEHLNKLKEILERRYKRKFSDLEVSEIGRSLLAYFDILARNSIKGEPNGK